MKKYMRMLMMLLVVMALVACSGGTDDPETDGDVVIGVISPNTGDLAVYGTSVVNAVKMAIDEINEAGGVLGGRELVVSEYLDDRGNSTEGANALNRLISNGVSAVIGSVTSGVTAGLASIADANDMLLLTPTATNDDVTVGYPTVFRACYADSYQSSVVAQFMAETLEVTKVGVLYASGDAYSAGMYEGFRAAAESLGLEIVAVESTSATNDTDYNTQWANIVASGAEAVFAPFYYSAVGPYIIPQARSNGYEGAIVGADGWDGTTDYMVEDKAVYNNTYFTNHYASDDPASAVQNFVTGYAELYGETPNALAALGYDSVYMLKEAIEAAGSADTADIIDALTGMTFSGVTGSFTLNDDNTPEKPAAIIEFVDGAMVWRDTVGGN